MNCDSVREKLNVYLDDELEGPQREAVREHLADCPDCSLCYEELKKLDQDLHSALLTDVDPSDEFTRELLDQAEREFPGRVSTERKTGFTPAGAGTLIAGLTLVLGLFIGGYLGIGFLEFVTFSTTERVATQESTPEQSTMDDTAARFPNTVDAPPATVEAVSFRDAYQEVTELEAAQNP